MESYESRRQSLQDEVFKTITENINKKRIPKGTIKNLASTYGVSKNHMRYIFKKTREESGIVTIKKYDMLEKEKNNRLVQMVRELNVIRQLPNQNRNASSTIIDALHNRLPYGGAALFIGTPTPFAVSDNKKNNVLLTDELEVGISLNLTTDKDKKPTIVIGNLISPERAYVKGQMWLHNNTTHTWPIIVDAVDRNSYTKYIVKMVEQFGFLKVVLMTSGVWCCCKSSESKYEQDFNFKSPSEYLTKEYPNLHILAMTMWKGRQFKIIHLHNGKQTILTKERN